MDAAKEIIKDVVEMEYEGNVKAIACVVVDSLGHIRVMFGYGEGTRLPMLGGTVLLQKNIMEDIEKNPKGNPTAHDERR